jgi:glyoxylase-like metal-dependent hydrolase (beta-lactamase superfamily II)
MPAYVCVTCGVQYAESDAPPAACPICEDERQYVGWNGQQWTTLPEMLAKGYRNVLREEDRGLTSITTVSAFGIGQQALLVQNPTGNLLWDCVSFVDDATIAAVRDRGGIQAIAISHPHFYATCVEWSRAFGHVPIYIHAADRRWVMRPSPDIVLWEGDAVQALPDLTVVHVGGHFDGATVVHWPEGAEGRGAVLSGDTLQVVMDRRYVSFMYSYPNLIPLSAESVEAIAAKMRRYRYERIYGAFNGRTARVEGAEAVERSAERYVRHLRAAESAASAPRTSPPRARG